jgi:hypothetical protein
MKKEKKQRVLAWPPSGFHWIEDIEELEKLNAIYSKLMAISGYFSYFQEPDIKHPVEANMVYGFWHIIRDICDELADILKVDYWTEENGKKAEEGEEE